MFKKMAKKTISVIAAVGILLPTIAMPSVNAYQSSTIKTIYKDFDGSAVYASSDAQTITQTTDTERGKIAKVSFQGLANDGWTYWAGTKIDIPAGSIKADDKYIVVGMKVKTDFSLQRFSVRHQWTGGINGSNPDYIGGKVTADDKWHSVYMVYDKTSEAENADNYGKSFCAVDGIQSYGTGFLDSNRKKYWAWEDMSYITAGFAVDGYVKVEDKPYSICIDEVAIYTVQTEADYMAIINDEYPEEVSPDCVIPNTDALVTAESLTVDGNRASRENVCSGNYEYTVKVANASPHIGIMSIIALYDDDVFVGASVNFDNSSSNDKIITTSLNIPNANDGMSLRTYVWDKQLFPIRRVEGLDEKVPSGGINYADDDFCFFASGQEKKLNSSYDLDDIGGSYSADGLSRTIDDVSTKAPVRLQREVNPITGNAVWELGFNSTNIPNGTVISLRNGETDAIKLTADDKYLYAVSANNTSTKIASLSTTSTYGLKVLFDTENNKYTLYINGTKRLTDVGFVNSVDSIDHFYIDTSDAGIGRIQLNHMRLYKDYLINERFQSSTSKLSGDWTTIGAGVYLSNEKTSVTDADRYALKITDSTSTGEVGISKNISYNSTGLWTEYDFFTAGNTPSLGAKLSANGTDIIKIGANNLDFGYWKDGNFVSLYTMQPNLWYNAQIRYVGDKANIYLNHKLVAENVALPNKKVEVVAFSIGQEATGVGYIDNIIVKEMSSKLPDDYVSEPVKPQKNTSTLVGVQSCSLWAEGRAQGWDCIAGYPERKPYLGYFDEASPEFTDWETKWMVEHGIDFQMYCWFRQGSYNKPVAKPRNGIALHDGYMNSEYSDKLKFCFVWENKAGAGVASVEDFDTNILPYWMEYYFKDSRYLVIDNKPVMAILDYKWLRDQLGGEGAGDNAAALIVSHIKAACVDAGFDGAYVMFQSSSRLSADLNLFKDAGADAVYSYSMFASNPANQLERLHAMSDLDIIDIVASPGTGVNSVPWGVNRTEGFISPTDFTSLLTNIRDNYLPKQSGLASKLITLDNWNEYSEGHMLAPTGINGFGYVDAIRSVFTTNTTHTDDLPTDLAKARFQNLYVQNRTTPQSVLNHELDAKAAQEASYINYGGLECNETPIAEPYFWSLKKMNMYTYYNIDNFTGNGSTISGTATSIDPYLYLKNFTPFDSTNVRQIKIRLKADAGMVQVFFATEEDPKFSEEKSFQKNYTSNGQFVDITIDTNGNSLFTGNITNVRIDPMMTTGTFEIDYVRFMGIDTSITVPCTIDGVSTYPVRSAQIVNGVKYVSSYEYASKLGYSYSLSFDKSTLRMRNLSTDTVYDLAIGSDALLIDDETYFPLVQMATYAGHTAN